MDSIYKLAIFQKALKKMLHPLCVVSLALPLKVSKYNVYLVNHLALFASFQWTQRVAEVVKGSVVLRKFGHKPEYWMPD